MFTVKKSRNNFVVSSRSHSSRAVADRFVAGAKILDFPKEFRHFSSFVATNRSDRGGDAV